MQGMDNISVLIVEDQPSDLELAKEALTQIEGIRSVSHVENLQSLMEIANVSQFDVILLDLGLPESKGLETMDLAKNTLKDSLNAHTPIIVLTGLQDFAISKGALKAGAKDYLVKGEFGSHELIRALTFATFGKNNPVRSVSLIQKFW